MISETAETAAAIGSRLLVIEMIDNVVHFILKTGSKTVLPVRMGQWQKHGYCVLIARC